ncbi:hypothetical protein ACJ72_00697 [Emergomyces africanus]|uniref:Uncharacterized protein n=1 Tax=Emergomyces africanus TaxID=1955775 RepID=A0A1B7P7D3_9EURO|nr:hypothetical protein ACJ72_00697 [Emergomyces africanus]
MAFAIPKNLDDWLEQARRAGVDQLSPCDPTINNLPSASNMEQNIFLSFRSFWETHYANTMDSKVLGISEEDHHTAKKYLSKSDDYKRYINDVKEYRNQRRPLSQLTGLGAFALVRHFQQQINQTDNLTSSTKHDVSPTINTRSRTAAAAHVVYGDTAPIPFNLSGRTGAVTPSNRSSSQSSSDGYPGCESSPLAPYSRARNADLNSEEPSQNRDIDMTDVHSSPNIPASSPLSNIPTSSPLSDMTAVSATAASILYAPTADEAIVKTFLILLLNALGIGCATASAEWSIKRLSMKHIFGSSKLEARTDGCLRKDDGQVMAIVEVKPHIRSKNEIPIKMQETTQIVAWIAQEGFPIPSTRRIVLLSQDRHEVYLTIPNYDSNYIKHLKGEADATTPLSLLHMNSYGPWDIYDSKSLHNLCGYLLALTVGSSY